ncbi:methionine biosynthesis protein MetW [Muricoccus radiodurans]|uniref:methionine biosynthesis protein MetW n=1 Tax=Muricoccus radiodurans TaxID=2231721 RepID=UPI003CF4F219
MASESSGTLPNHDVAVGLGTESPLFVDFGCGSGRSLSFAEEVMGGPGIGIDRSPDAIATCAAKGYAVRTENLLDFQERSVANASFAMDVLPELGGGGAFEQGWINIVRAARDFTLIQHLCFDTDDALWSRGLYSPTFQNKAIQFKPRISDYLQLVDKHARALNIVGVAMFGIGAATIEPFRNVSLDIPQTGDRLDLPTYRSVRVLVARKKLSRFEHAVKRLAVGESIIVWKQSGQ